MKTTTRSADAFETISTFFDTEGLEWNKVCGIYTDGAPAMLGSKSGFQAKVKEKSLQAKGFHCIIHRYALACNTLPGSLKEVLDLVIKLVNYVKGSALNSRLFKEFCKDMSSDHEVLLFYCAVRWLSKGNVVGRVFELREELQEFLQLKGQKTIVAALNDEECSKRLAYLSDVFGHLNKLNLKLQGPELNFITFKDSLCGFIAKLQNWRRKINLGNIAMFENLSDLHNSGIGPTEQLKSEISEHLHALEKELNRYFPDVAEEEESKLVRNPFSLHLDISEISDDLQDELINMRNDSSARELFLEKSLSQFWVSMQLPYPKISRAALKIVVPFVSTYLCERGFSTLVQIKTKARNKLDVQDHMRLALCHTQPRIKKLCAELQAHPSH